MEHDDLRTAWQSLEARMARSDAVQLALLRETRMGRVRSLLRPLVWGNALQCLLGIGLILLGVACWTGNPVVTGLFATGLVVHAFGVLTVVLAALTIVLAATLDPEGPVLRVQKRLDLLLRLQTLNGVACGAPWAVMWLLVVVAFAGLGHHNEAAAPTPAWIAWCFWIGILGTLLAWAWMWRQYRRKDPDAGTFVPRADGTDSIRRSQRLVDEIARFERD